MHLHKDGDILDCRVQVGPQLCALWWLGVAALSFEFPKRISLCVWESYFGAWWHVVSRGSEMRALKRADDAKVRKVIGREKSTC